MMLAHPALIIPRLDDFHAHGVAACRIVPMLAGAAMKMASLSSATSFSARRRTNSKEAFTLALCQRAPKIPQKWASKIP
jgi:hypothetical protein